ncbi:MAG TPA: DUF1592 domain-containing protein [Bryobacteraceae bacterium]|nr:DUF1592 domain-containing protein [Bryobacteraceae bacterium]
MRYLSVFILLSILPLATAQPKEPVKPTFQDTVQPVLKKNCTMCHNDKMASGGLSVERFTDPASLEGARGAWEQIVAKLRTGEMPPRGTPQPTQEQRDSLVKFVQDAFDAADRARPPDPGRVLARRLNRVEYANTVRDVFGVRYRTGEEFPADDSVLGFDNIGEVLTVSPLLMEKYVYAAERIASLAIGADPLPKPTLLEQKPEKVKRIDIGATEANEYLDYSGEYVFRVWVRGHLGPKGQPVKLQMFVDDKPVHAVDVPTVENETTTVARDAQRTNQEVKVYLTAGEHKFRAEIVGEEFRKPVPVPPTGRRPGGGGGGQQALSIFPEKFDLLGPFPAKGEHPSRAKILVCDPATGSACIQKILAPLARRAYRRPVTKLEVQTLVDVAKRASDMGFTPDQSIQFAIQAMLVSPNFLFRVEADPKGKFGAISEIELASRLSYFLWSSAPDDELLTLAEQKKLRKPGILEQQVSRMLADKRSLAIAENFAGQWLETRSLAAMKPDAQKFPTWSPQLQEDMETETRLFFDSILRENRPVSEFLTADYSFLNSRLARHYGIETVQGPEFRKVQLDPNQRGGILTHASVLTLTSYPVRTSPVLRGKYILDVILGAPPPPPPADVPALNEDKVASPASLREALSRHRSDPICSSCHSRMDPLGFGLENYDPIGRWRTEDNKAPIQVGGTLPNGTEFSTPAELKLLLTKELPEFTRNLTEKMLTYALGRGLENYDKLLVRETVAKMEKSDYRFQTLIREIATSLPFQARRGQLSNPTEVASK